MIKQFTVKLFKRILRQCLSFFSDILHFSFSPKPTNGLRSVVKLLKEDLRNGIQCKQFRNKN